MTKKTQKTQKPSARRWSIGIFMSAANGQPVVMYCNKTGEIAPYLSKSVTSKKTKVHLVFVNMTYAEARKRLLRAAGRMAKRPAKESLRAA